MKLTHLLAASVAALFLSACNNAEPQSNGTRSADYVIKNVTLVDWLKGEPNVSEQQTLVVNDGYISGVFANAEAPAFDDNTQVIDAEGQYVLPGMAEMHGHVPPATDFGDFPKRYADDMLFLYIANGVTTVRGMLGYPHQLQLKSDIESGKRQGPTLYLAGPSFSGNTIESVEQVTERVISQRDEGWDLLKVHPGLTLEEYEAMASTARQAGMDFAGHVPAEVGLKRAMEAGQRTIDHLDGYLAYVDAMNREITQDELDLLVSMMLEHDVAVVPTQALWKTLIGAADPDKLKDYPEIQLVPKAVREGWLNYYDNPSSYFNQEQAQVQQENRQKLLHALHEGGAEIIFGTDAPQLFSVPGYSIHHEIQLMSEAGIPMADILRSATVAAGDYFAEQDTFGRIAAGHRADFILLKDNPLENPDTLRENQGVMVRGQWLSREAIDRKVEEIRAAYAQ